MHAVAHPCWHAATLHLAVPVYVRLFRDPATWIQLATVGAVGPRPVLAYCLRPGTSLDEAQTLCDLLNRSVVLTKAVTSIEINGGGDGTPA